MKTPPAFPPLRSAAAFTLVELMIVVAIIGLIATMAIPAFTRIRTNAQAARYVNDLRVFTQAFESYSLVNGTWPPNAGTGVVPTGMSGEFKDVDWTTQKNSIGGRWNWDRNVLGVSAGISVVGATFTDAQMTLIDAKIDDGDLTTGFFQKISGRFVYILEP